MRDWTDDDIEDWNVGLERVTWWTLTPVILLMRLVAWPIRVVGRRWRGMR